MLKQPRCGLDSGRCGDESADVRPYERVEQYIVHAAEGHRQCEEAGVGADALFSAYGESAEGVAGCGSVEGRREG